MSIQKYQLAREFREGAAARILNQAQDFSKCSDIFMQGWYFASQHIMGSLYENLNVYLEGIGEEKIEMVEVLRDATNP